MVKNLPANAGGVSWTPGLGRSLGGGNDNPLQYSCWENPMDRGTWRATVHRVAKSQTRLSTHRLSCSMTCGIFLDQGWNLCLLHWQADSLPLRYQGNLHNEMRFHLRLVSTSYCCFPGLSQMAFLHLPLSLVLSPKNS